MTKILTLVVVEPSTGKALLKEFKDVFHEELPEGLSPRRAFDHVIETGNVSPINRNAFVVGAAPLEQTRQIEDLQKGV